jgi:cytidyltransferase-like protein
MQKVALAVMRLQPLHRGHEMVIDTMLKEAQEVIVAIGSIQATDARNPYSYEQRKAMLKARYGACDRLHILGLRDIGAPTASAWAAYVLASIQEAGLPRPTCYYAGAEDGDWFEGVLPVRTLDRQREGGGISATAIRADLDRGRSVSERLSPPVADLIKRWQHGA